MQNKNSSDKHQTTVKKTTASILIKQFGCYRVIIEKSVANSNVSAIIYIQCLRRTTNPWGIESRVCVQSSMRVLSRTLLQICDIDGLGGTILTFLHT